MLSGLSDHRRMGVHMLQAETRVNLEELKQPF